MIPKKHFFMLLLFVFFVSAHSFAQEDVLRLVPYNESQEYLVDQILADTLADGSRPAGRVYELDGGEVYLNTGILYIEADETLHLRSSNDERPVIYQFPTGTGDNPEEPPGYLFRTRGGDVILENLAISGYYEPGDDPANGSFDYFYNVQGGLLRSDAEGASFYVTGSIFSNIAGQILRTNASTEVLHFEDNIFANLGALSTSNFGAGKGIDLRESSVDSLILLNNTFVNYQDRVVRHYNFSNPLEGTGDITYGRIEHNTFVNGMGFHGVLSLGNVGDKIEITNNLFLDAFAGGEDSTDVTRTAEWANTGQQYANGNNRMAWIFAAPNESTEWVVENNYYAVSSEGQSFFDAHAEITEGEPLSIYIRDALGSASASAFTRIGDPGMAEIPDLMVGMLDYYVTDAEKTKDTPNDTWDPETQDFDRKPITYYAGEFDAAYSTSSEAYTGAEGGFPAGDLNWFPDKKEEWTSVSNEYEGPDAELPSEFVLHQNYPNPFNPTTKISFVLPQAQEVSLKVYDMLGREVATLANKDRFGAGLNTLDFDAANLSSGIYIYRLSSSNIMLTKKMTLIK